MPQFKAVINDGHGDARTASGRPESLDIQVFPGRATALPGVFKIDLLAVERVVRCGSLGPPAGELRLDGIPRRLQGLSGRQHHVGRRVIEHPKSFRKRHVPPRTGVARGNPRRGGIRSYQQQFARRNEARCAVSFATQLVEYGPDVIRLSLRGGPAYRALRPGAIRLQPLCRRNSAGKADDPVLRIGCGQLHAGGQSRRIRSASREGHFPGRQNQQARLAVHAEDHTAFFR